MDKERYFPNANARFLLEKLGSPTAQYFLSKFDIDALESVETQLQEAIDLIKVERVRRLSEVSFDNCTAYQIAWLEN